MVGIWPALLPAQPDVHEAHPCKGEKVQRTGGGSRTFGLRPTLPKGRVN